jgi:uncharacterized membrane protein YcaP (DUF421 family)
MLVPELPFIEKILRSVLVYLFLIVALRLAGKREVAQLNPLDFIVLLTLSNTVQNAIIGNDNSVTGGLVGAATLLIMNYFVVRFLYSSPRINRWIEGGSAVLIKDGKLNKVNLKKELITIAELESAAHKQGFSSLKQVDKAILEPGGSLSFSAKTPLPEEIKYQEIVARLNQIQKEIALLHSKLQLNQK